MNKERCVRGVAIGLSLLVGAISLSSCQTLRKKFTREKKGKVSNEIIPVLQPIDYATQETNPQERYAYHYAMWQIWQKDLTRALEHKESGKRLKYLLAQNLNELESMSGWLSAEWSLKLGAIISEYRSLESSFNLPDAFKDYSNLARQAGRLGKIVRLEFSSDRVEPVLRKNP